MKKKDVFISIIGTQSINGESETNELYTNGVYYKDKEAYYIAYEESETSGFANCRTVVKVIDDDKVIMMRSGASHSHLIIESNRRCVGEYGLEGKTFSLGVTAKQIQNELDDSGGKLLFAYQLDLNAQYLSDNEVTITVQDR